VARATLPSPAHGRSVHRVRTTATLVGLMGYIVLAAAAGLLVGVIWAAIQRYRHRGQS
jgi:hypothetical protein